MNRSVQPPPLRTTPSAPAAVSSVRTTVVPTAHTRRPSRRTWFTASAVASGVGYPSAAITCCAGSSTSTGLNVPGPTCSTTSATMTPRRWISASSSGGKGRPAGGGAPPPVPPREHGLVAVAVLLVRRPGDVRRQRHRSVPLHHGAHVEPSREADPSKATAHDIGDFRHRLITERDGPAALELAPRMHHRQPGAVGLGVRQQDLGGPAAGSPPGPPGPGDPARTQ